VSGYLVAVLGLLRGLPTGYQRDLQEDKAPLFDGLAVLESSLRVMAGVIGSLVVDEHRMRAAATAGYTTATSVADVLVEQRVPFRAAHHVVGTLVARAEAVGLDLWEIPDEAVTATLGASDDERARELADDATIPGRLREAAHLESALARPDVIGGTAPARVAAELRAAAKRLGL
jgi:argininosuccinate lyase